MGHGLSQVGLSVSDGGHFYNKVGSSVERSGVPGSRYEGELNPKAWASWGMQQLLF